MSWTTIPDGDPIGGFVRPTVSIDEALTNDDEDASELSPQPSPLAPPQPQPFAATTTTVSATAIAPQESQPGRPNPRSTTIADKPYSMQQKTDLADELSVPSLPQAPSPHSPPPPSLFSDTDEGEGQRQGSKAISQRPMSEVHLRYSRVSVSRMGSSQSLRVITNASSSDHDDYSSSSADVSTANLQRSLSSQQSSAAATRPSNLLPALLQLKQDLTRSHQKLFLLEQENEALNRQFETERTQWQEEQQQLESLVEKERKNIEEQVNTQCSTIRELEEQISTQCSTIRELECQLANMQQEKQQAVDHNELIQQELDQKQSKWEQRRSEYEQLQNQLDETELALRHQIEENQLLRNRIDDTVRHKDQGMASIKKSAQSEVDYWKKELSMAHQEFRDKLSQSAQSTAAYLHQLEEHDVALKKANQTIAELRAEKLALRQELANATTRRHTSIATDAACQTDDEDAGAVVHDLEDYSSLHDGDEETFFPEPASCHDSNVSHASTITEEGDLESPVEPLPSARMPSLNESPQIRSENASVDHVHTAFVRHGSLGAFQEYLDSTKEQQGRRTRQLPQIEEEKISVRADQPTTREQDKKIRQLPQIEEETISVPADQPTTREQSESKQTDEQRDCHYYEDRMHELLHQHQIELDQLKERLVREASQEAIRVVLTTLGDRGITNLTENLSTTHRQDCGVSTAAVGINETSLQELTETVAVETMRAVTATTTPDAGSEKSNRRSLDAGSDNRENNNSADNSTMKDPASDPDNNEGQETFGFQRLEREWQWETQELLNSIQQECNEVFERNKTNLSRASPRTVAVADISDYRDEGIAPQGRGHREQNTKEALTQDGEVTASISNHVVTGESIVSQQNAAQMPPELDLDRTLDETEALLRSLLRAN